VALQPPRFLAAGDVVRVEIERIGHIENPVIEEPEETQRL
jgi:2-keto-4-pentenoate hydratase/2-oxohepta-3-ene-1,7-dioic acid hydratase in catechol pathway